MIITSIYPKASQVQFVTELTANVQTYVALCFSVASRKVFNKLELMLVPITTLHACEEKSHIN